MKPGGRFYTEDLCALGDIDDGQWQDLERDLAAITLPDLEAYRLDLENAGFIIESFTDMTADWAEFTEHWLNFVPYGSDTIVYTVQRLQPRWKTFTLRSTPSSSLVSWAASEFAPVAETDRHE